MSQLQRAGAVSAAKEGMALLYGPMSADDAQAFENLWAPLYDFPSLEIVAYLNRLNPLLAQTLAQRESMLRVAAVAETAMLDAGLAVAADEPQGWFDALAFAVAERQDRLMSEIHGDLDATVATIAALGNPPDPLAARCAARRRYRGSFPAPPGPPLDLIWTDEAGDEHLVTSLLAGGGNRWLIYRVTRSAVARYEELEAQGHDLSTLGLVDHPDAEKTGRIAVHGVSDMLAVAELQPDGRVLVEQSASFFLISEIWNLDPSGWASVTQARESLMAGTTTVAERIFWSSPETAPFSFPHTPERLRREADEVGERILEMFGHRRASDPQLIADLLAGRLEETPEDSATPPSAPAAATPALPTTGHIPDTARREAVAFHGSVIELLEKNIARERQELDSERDPERRQQLAIRVLHLQTDLQSGHDLLASVATGTIVHTRSTSDEYARQQFLRRTQEGAERIEQVQRILALVDRQIQLLPRDQQEAMRRSTWEALDAKAVVTGDVEQARRLASAVHEQVQG